LSEYYYLVASLGALRFDAPPAVGREEFLSRCREQMSDVDFRSVQAAGLYGQAEASRSSPVLRKWNRWETSLRNALVRLRAHELGWDAHPHLQEIEEELGPGEAAREALSAANPLEAERLLSRARWSYLDELEVGHFFDTERLVVYALKLLLLERMAAMGREPGLEEFQRVSEAVRAKIGEANG